MRPTATVMAVLRVFVLVFAFAFMGTQAHAQEQDLVFPQYVNGVIDGEKNYTRLVLRNPTSEPDQVVLRFYPDREQEQAEPSTSTLEVVEVDIPANGVAEFVSSGEGVFQSGAVTVTSTMQGTKSRVRADLIYELLGYKVSVPPADVVTHAEYYVSYSGAIEGENTGIAIYNPSLDAEGAVEVDAKLLDADGMEVASTMLTLEASEHRAMYVDEEGLFPDFFDSSAGETAEFTGTLSVSTSAGVSAIGLLQDRMTGAVSTVQPILRDLEITGLRTGTSRGFFGGVSAYAAWEQTPGAIGYHVVVEGVEGYPSVLDAHERCGKEDEKLCNPSRRIYPVYPGDELTFNIRAIGTERLGEPSSVMVTVDDHDAE